MAKIKIDNELYKRAEEIAKRVGYSSVDEFTVHLIERELNQLEGVETDEALEERLRGLGYIE